ncbi:MAG: M42 family metallopeptidase [Clostridia bacterium]|nr:M42 family metallopeptidase [Clostridia bacterium]
MFGRLKELTELNGVSGNEGEVRKYIREYVKQYADEVWTDSMGNLFAHKKANGRKIMICGHMDEVGMMVTRIRDDGLISYAAAGIDPRVVVGKRVAVGKDKVMGVIGSKAIHLQSRSEFESSYKHSQLFIDIGAKDKADALKYVNIGDYITFTTKYEEFGDGLIKAKALDDRIGCCMVMEMLKNSYDCDLYAVFTVQEELGLRGARSAAFAVEPELALILEGTTANDMAEVQGHQWVTRVGKGVAITFMDRGTITRPAMFDELKNCALENNVIWQIRQGNSGGTDAGRIHLTKGGCVTGGISVPCRYIHSAVSVAAKSDIENMYKLVDSFLKEKRFEKVLSVLGQ